MIPRSPMSSRKTFFIMKHPRVEVLDCVNMCNFSYYLQYYQHKTKYAMDPGIYLLIKINKEYNKKY